MAENTLIQRSRARNAGSGFTIFTFGHQPIAFCEQVALTTPSPVGQGMAVIQPMDEPYALEIMTPAAAGIGQIVLNLFELFGTNGKNSKVWDRLGLKVGETGNPFGSGEPTNVSSYLELEKENGIFYGAVDIVDIFIKQAQAKPEQLNITKIIRPLATEAKTPLEGLKPYTEEFHGCKITNVIDGEQVSVGSLEILKQITVAYTYATRDGESSGAFKIRDNAL